ncbi:MAG: site-2 protease family protein [Pseudobdellovibrio sp.]
MDLVDVGGKLAFFYVPFLFALCFHEFSHGIVAKWRGDNTAEQMGRLTLNPMAHMDPIGTFLLPVAAIVFHVPIFFGWAKPVPVNSRNLKNIRTDMFWIALAGPASNLFLAVVSTVFIYFAGRYGFLGEYSETVFKLLQMFILTNLFLAVFNFLPIHPLDGGKIIARFLPASINYKLEQNEQVLGMILLALVMTGALGVLRYPVAMIFSYLSYYSGVPVLI